MGFDPKGSYSRDIKYLGTSLLQLANLAAVSYQCEQFIRYECMASVMQISLYAWWVSRDGETWITGVGPHQEVENAHAE